MTTRQALRDQIFTRARPESQEVEFFGGTVELRQPSLEEILTLRDDARDNPAAASAQMIIDYCFVPGTNEKVFDETDRDLIMKMPFGPDLSRMNKAIEALTDIDVSSAEKNSDEIPES